MTDPTVTCLTCKRRRNVLLHQRADEPVKAAKRWLRNNCAKFLSHRDIEPDCKLLYTAGFGVGGRATGQ